MVDWLIGILKHSAIVLYRLFVLDPFLARSLRLFQRSERPIPSV
jgi:hypothetical protein